MSEDTHSIRKNAHMLRPTITQSHAAAESTLNIQESVHPRPFINLIFSRWNFFVAYLACEEHLPARPETKREQLRLAKLIAPPTAPFTARLDSNTTRPVTRSEPENDGCRATPPPPKVLRLADIGFAVLLRRRTSSESVIAPRPTPIAPPLFAELSIKAAKA